MLERILPDEIIAIFENRLNVDKIYEVRLRSEMPIVINYGGRFYFLTKRGISDSANDAVICKNETIQNVIVRATEYSLYTVNNQITKGFITIKGGIRIGICGELVWDNGKLKTIKNFSSLNIRIPHEISGASLASLRFIYDTRLHSSLIIAPPGAGKTTILRDLSKKLSAEKNVKNILLVDERSEIAAVYDKKAQLDVGITTDIICNCNKAYAFSYGIRSMRPDLIITDELMDDEDILAVKRAVLSGVKVIASIHASSIEEVVNKPILKDLVKEQIFTRYIILSDRTGPGKLDYVFDGELKSIFFGE